MQAVIQYLLFLFTGTLLHAQATPDNQLSRTHSEINVASEEGFVPCILSEGIKNGKSTYKICREETVSTTNHGTPAIN